MYFLNKDALLEHIEDRELIYPLPEGDDPGELIEGIKYPLSFGGEVLTSEWRDVAGDAGDDVGNGKERVERVDRVDTANIPPGEYKILRTKEQIKTQKISDGRPFNIFGFVYLPGSFVRSGLAPCFQGIIDAGWDAGELHITLHNNTQDTEIRVDIGHHICYVFFMYLPGRLDERDKKEGSKISKPAFEFQPDQMRSIEEVRSRTIELEEQIETLENMHEDLNEKVNEVL